MESHKLKFSQFNVMLESDLESLTEEQLNEIFGKFFSKLSPEAKKKKEEELKKKIADTQARIAANKDAWKKAKTSVEKDSPLAAHDKKLPASRSELGQGRARAAEREWLSQGKARTA